MITAMYAAICALLLAKLAMNVVKQRKKHKISLGDGNVPELQSAIAAHSNASQYIPITLIMLFLLEYNQANFWIVNLFGVALLVSRFVHAFGMINKFSARVLGMQITIYNMIALSFANLTYYVLF